MQKMMTHDLFAIDNSKSDGLQSLCRNCHSFISKLHYIKNKQKYRESAKRHKDKLRREIDSRKDKPCADCGIQFPPWIMQFDHRNPEEKEFTIGYDKWSWSLKKTLKEIEKCDVVCANCHAHRTYLKSKRRGEVKE